MGGGRRRQRLGVMVLVAVLALAGLAAQRGRRGETASAVVAASPPRHAVAAVAGIAAVRAPAAPAPEAPAGAGEAGSIQPGEVAGGLAPEIRLPVEGGPLAPDVVVTLERPGPEAGPPLRVTHAHASDSAQVVAGPALVDGAGGSGDGIEGLEPGARYWFGPEGLERVRVVMEAQR